MVLMLQLESFLKHKEEGGIHYYETSESAKPLNLERKAIYTCAKVCRNDTEAIILSNDTLHEVRIEMCPDMGEALGLPTAFRLRGGSIAHEHRVYNESYQRQLEWQHEGVKPKLNTTLPQFLAITSSIARHGMIGPQMERVLTIVECPYRLSGGVDGIIPFHSGETNFVSAEPGTYESVDCKVFGVFDDKPSLYDVVGDFKMDLALIIKSDEV